MNIGFTRRDKTPPHWRDDYRLAPTAKKLIQGIKAEREQLFKEFEALPDDMPDEEYVSAGHELSAKLDVLIEREDKIRQSNLK